MFKNHYHEKYPRDIKKLFDAATIKKLKNGFKKDFDKKYLIGGLTADISVVPRFIPHSHWKIVDKSCRALTELILKYVTQEPREIKKDIIPTQITSFLINHLKVFSQRKKRLCGGLRFDFAIEGPLTKNNPPKLLEINEIGVDGMSRSSHIQETILKYLPQLKNRIINLNPSKKEIEFLSRLGKNILRVQYDLYNWEEEILYKNSLNKIKLSFVSPANFRLDINKKYKLLKKTRVYIKRGKLYFGDNPTPQNAYMVSYALEYKDYKEAKNLFKTLVKSKAHNYNPFITGFVGPKSSLVTLKKIKSRFLTKAQSILLDKVIPSTYLLKDRYDDVLQHPENYVLKEVDGLGGEGVFVGRDILKKIKKIRNKNKWVVQEIIKLNTIDVNGVLSKPKKVIADLGVYVHYDWQRGKLKHFSVSGAITRASNKSKKVNVNLGGLQVPVMVMK